MKRNLGFGLLFALVIPISMFAQQSFNEDFRVISDRLDALSQDYTYEDPKSSVLDTLLYNKQNFRSEEVPNYTASTTEQRLYDIASVIPLDYNRHVQRYIELYTKQRRGQTSRMLGLQDVYFPIFEEELDKAGLPMELKYLPIVESALNPHARSRVGATGLWQFMLATARQYGLRVNSFVDERKDPFKSTKAAIHYLQDAYDEFDDWLLAIASYNCGIGNVRKAIYRSGGKRNFWAIMSYLPRETRGYVPAFISAVYFSNYASEHNLYPVHVDFSYLEDSIEIRRMDISLKEIADMTGVQFQELKNLNPELKLARIPYSNKPYTLRVPRTVGDYFAQNDAMVKEKFGKKRENYAQSAAYSKQYVSASGSKSPSRNYKPSGKLVYYTVRSGDVVGTIAERYGVSPRSISRWNGLRNYRIRVGQKLKIYTNNPNGVATSSKKQQVPIAGSGSIYHTVKSGDTLWDISQRYTGTNISKIRQLNPGINTRQIKIGQRIRVR